MTYLQLDESFLAQYRFKQPKWGFDGLGYIVYLRTYSRKKPDGTQERWDETVERVTVGNFAIEAKRLAEIGRWDDAAKTRLTAEMERFYHLTFNLVVLPPGRGLWMSGTAYAEKVGDAENNCWGVSMRPQEWVIGDGKPLVSFAPCFTFDQAMKGGGVGVNVQRKYTSQIPMVANQLELVIVCDIGHADYTDRLEPLGVCSYYLGGAPCIRVDDSREGWALALRDVIDAHYNGTTKLAIDISGIRPYGAEIVGFGGIASGPYPLVTMLQRINDILNSRVGDYVTSTEWGDVIQNIGCCVVSGNVRRTALILIGDSDDREYVESKNYSLPQNLVASQWRWASNNSVDINPSTDRQTLESLAHNIYYNGEPGYVSIELSRNFGRIIDGFQQDVDGEVEIFNPCGEVTLPNGSPCNLFEINLPRVHELIANGVESPSLYDEVAYIGVRYAYRITFRPYDWSVTRDVVSRHRRLGVGITGITDWVLAKFGAKAIIGFSETGDPQFNTSVTAALDDLYSSAKRANVEHAAQLDAAPSIKITTVKPSGSVSLLMGVSPGQHFHWSRFMIRRVRMSSTAPLVPILLECGYYVEPVVAGFNADGSPKYNPETVVVEFPVKAPTADHVNFQSAGDVPLAEQAAIQALLASYWSDNAVSATLSFHKAKPHPVFFADGSVLLDKFGEPDSRVNPAEEAAVISEITDILDRYKTVIKSTSLLPYATDVYPQMPYEEITEQRYHEIAAKITAKPWELVTGSLMAESVDTVDASAECIGGACPIR